MLEVIHHKLVQEALREVAEEWSRGNRQQQNKDPTPFEDMNT